MKNLVESREEELALPLASIYTNEESVLPAHIMSGPGAMHVYMHGHHFFGAGKVCASLE